MSAVTASDLPFPVPAPRRDHARVPFADRPLLLATDESDAVSPIATFAALVASRRRGNHLVVRLANASRADVIARESEAMRCGLIVMGLRPPVMRPGGDDTTMLVMRRAVAPVLAVAPGLCGLPRRVIVAMDFSRASLHAAHAALGLLADGAQVTLVNVQPDLGLIADASSEYSTIYAQGVGPSLARLRHSLDAPPGVTLDSVILRGDPLTELLALAERTGADLIAAGTRRQPTNDHMAVGGVTTGLVRDARFSLLVAQPVPCC